MVEFGSFPERTDGGHLPNHGGWRSVNVRSGRRNDGSIDMSKRQLLKATLVIGVGLATISSALAQSYPSRPVQLVVPFSGGSGTDIAARGLAEGLVAQLGQGAVVVNREGASGTLALAAVAHTAPDGYTLAFTPQGPLTIQPHLKPNLSYRLDTFQPLCQVYEDSFGILVGPTSPIVDFNPSSIRSLTSRGS